MHGETTNNRALHAILAGGKYRGEFTRLAPDGQQVVYRANFLDGQIDGIEESCDPQTGMMTGYARYTNAKLNGVARAWDTNGKSIGKTVYDNGVNIAADRAPAKAAHNL